MAGARNLEGVVLPVRIDAAMDETPLAPRLQVGDAFVGRRVGRAIRSDILVNLMARFFYL